MKNEPERHGAHQETREDRRRAPEAPPSLLRGNAIPIELLKSEQDRITAQEQVARQELGATEADLGGWEDVLRTAIKLAGICHAAYVKARPSVRRRFNQAVLEAVYLKDRKVARAELSEVFAPLLSGPSSNKPRVVLADRCANRNPWLILAASFGV
jgi:hypothetical protein